MKKKILIIASLTVVILIALCAAYFIKFNGEIEQMKPVETGLISDGITAIKDGFVNLYLIDANDGYIAIDAGANVENLKNQLNEMNIDPLKVKAVFLTHNHFDHIAGLSLFSNAVLYLSRNEKFNVKNMVMKLNDNESVEIGDLLIKAVSAPGHTIGSVNYILNGNVIFTGDNLRLIDGNVGTFNEFFNADTDKQKSFIREMKKMSGIKLMLTAHYGFTSEFEKSLEKFNE